MYLNCIVLVFTTNEMQSSGIITNQSKQLKVFIEKIIVSSEKIVTKLNEDITK